MKNAGSDPLGPGWGQRLCNPNRLTLEKFVKLKSGLAVTELTRIC